MIRSVETGPDIGAEAELIARARCGDAESLNQIARKEMPRVERFLIKLLGPRDDLDDLVQTVFVEFCRALPRFRGESKLSTFIGGITVRVAKRTMRPSAWVRRKVESSIEPVSLRPSPDIAAFEAEQLRRVRVLLDKVAKPKRIAFLLWALEGLSTREVAETMGASLSATRSRIFYAQKELKRRASKDPYLQELVEDLNFNA